MKEPARLAGLAELVRRQCQGPAPDGVRALAAWLVGHHGDAVQAVLFYGSCLRTGNEREGVADLYLLVDGYRAAYPGWAARAFNSLLPPNVFYVERPVAGGTVRAKYAVLSLGHFRHGTSPRWFPSYLWGRFTQPVRLLWARDAEVAAQVHESLAQAVTTFVTRVVPCLPARFDAAALWRDGLAMSYRTELRAEKKGRAGQLFDAYRPYYEALTAAAVAAVPLAVGGTEVPGEYQAVIAPGARRRCRLAWALRRAQGKVLSLLRLGKAAFTFQGAMDYVAWKLERHSGVRVELTPRVRRHPLLFGWGLLWRLYRRGVLR